MKTLWPLWIVLGVLVLLPVGRSSEAPLAIGAIGGLIFAWRERTTVRTHAGVRLAAIVFGCYWLAALASAPAAVAPEKTWSTVAALLRLLPFALFACLALRKVTWWSRLTDACAAIVLLWLLDAWVQILTGFSLAGAETADRLSGIFGAGNLKLGPVLAVLSPFVFIAARKRWGWRGLALAFAFQLMPILFAGSRAAWIMYALVALAFVWMQTRAPLRFAAWALAAACAAVLGIAVAWQHSGRFDLRFDRTLLALQGSEQALDTASAGRMRIWSTAARMIAAHPLAGVGVRGFRYAYPHYAQPGDAFVNARTDEGAYHAHQIVLEVLSETGSVGLALWLIGAVCAIRAWRRADALARERALAPALALAAMTFPLNTHLAFYSAWWGLLLWWLLALYCAALGADDDAGA
ncbi:MAG: O-antigen ligase family protein [Xanthomonadaceae bacterium]|nr:O-antigen ligase family protein [Xanthomonadaceae bacterium]